MIFLQFFVVAALVILVAMKVSSKAEWFESNTPIKGIIVGIILAASTSLPELVSGITAVMIDQPEMAASSILGSNFFNFLIMGTSALVYIKFKPNHAVSKQTNSINLFLIIIYSIFIIDYFYNSYFGNHINFITERISLVTVFIVIIYFTAINYFNQSGGEGEGTKVLATKDVVIKQLGITLVLVVILVFLSMQLASIADAIIKKTGMSPSSVGSVLVGASTSLPEFVSAFSLLKNKKYDIAFSATLGSNLFNFMILAVLDVVYKYNIVTVFSTDTNVLVLFGFVDAIVFYFMLKVKSDKLAILAIPFVTSILLYVGYLLIFFV